jgi:hypothetical protein
MDASQWLPVLGAAGFWFFGFLVTAMSLHAAIRKANRTPDDSEPCYAAAEGKTCLDIPWPAARRVFESAPDRGTVFEVVWRGTSR